MAAIDQGATHLWANTILFAAHPVQTSSRIGQHVRMIGQGPLIVEKYDDKDCVNNLLRRKGVFTMPLAWTYHEVKGESPMYNEFQYPAVVKPARGRGSHGVKLCRNAAEAKTHCEVLIEEGAGTVMIEEYLAGEEATVTVMPPTTPGGKYWSLPVVSRFNHKDGIAPYNGVVAVTANSRAIVDSEDPAYASVQRECEGVAAYLRVTAPIRIDVRRFKPGSKFALFDINMKPVSFELVYRTHDILAYSFQEHDWSWSSRKGGSGKSYSDGGRSVGLGLYRTTSSNTGDILDTRPPEAFETTGLLTGTGETFVNDLTTRRFLFTGPLDCRCRPHIG